MTGIEEPDSGRVSRTGGLDVGYLHQGDELVDTHTVREAVLGGKADHEWAADPTARGVVRELLTGIDLDRPVLGLSGGERRRCALAALLLDPARPGGARRAHQPPRRRGRRLARRAPQGRSPPRWWWSPTTAGSSTRSARPPGRCTTARSTPTRAGTPRSCSPRPSASGRPRPPRPGGRTWSARSSPGCAAAHRRAPRSRSSGSTPPTQLIEDVPPPRDRLELQRFATQRLGKDVLDVEDVDLFRGERQLLSHATWRLGPGDRIGLVGVNGAGKTSVLSLLTGDLAPQRRPGRSAAARWPCSTSASSSTTSTRRAGCWTPWRRYAGSPGRWTARS